jgi:hypothetical protein
VSGGNCFFSGKLTFAEAGAALGRAVIISGSLCGWDIVAEVYDTSCRFTPLVDPSGCCRGFPQPSLGTGWGALCVGRCEYDAPAGTTAKIQNPSPLRETH